MAKPEPALRREAIARIINMALAGSRLKVVSGRKGGPYKLVVGRLTLRRLWRVIERLTDLRL